MVPTYKHVLIVGAGSGLSASLARVVFEGGHETDTRRTRH